MKATRTAVISTIALTLAGCGFMPTATQATLPQSASTTTISLLTPEDPATTLAAISPAATTQPVAAGGDPATTLAAVGGSQSVAQAVIAEPTDEVPAEDWAAITDLFDRELVAVRQCLSEMPNCDTTKFEQFGSEGYYDFMIDYYQDPDSWADVYINDPENFDRRISYEGQVGDSIKISVCETDATTYLDENGDVYADELASWRGVYTVEKFAGTWLITDLTTSDQGTGAADNVCAFA